MINKTEGIVFNYIKYRDTSIIVRIFTKDYGFRSFVVNSVRSAKSKKKLGYFEPFNILEIVFYESQHSELHRLSDYKISVSHSSIRFNLKKSTIVIFLSEVLYKILSFESTANPELYTFLKSALDTFEKSDQHYENFHLQLLIQLTHHLGLGYDPDTMSLHGVTSEVNQLAATLAFSDFGTGIEANGTLRSLFLEAILNFYREHTGQNLDIKSLAILRQIFH